MIRTLLNYILGLQVFFFFILPTVYFPLFFHEKVTEHSFVNAIPLSNLVMDTEAIFSY